jgi:hypothetical protein
MIDPRALFDRAHGSAHYHIIGNGDVIDVGSLM